MNRKFRIIMMHLMLLGAVLGCGQLSTPESMPTAQSSATTEPAPTITTTATTESTATSQPSATPEPTATTQPSTAQMPGWKKFEVSGAEIWLPESYEGGDLRENLDLIVEALRNLGPDFEPMAQAIEQNPSLYVLWAFDMEVGPSGFLTNVTITNERVLSVVTVDTYLDIGLSQFPPQFEIVSRDIIMLGDYQAGRVLIDFELYGVVARQLLYVVKDGTMMWNIAFATGADEYWERLPDFEQSMLSFKTH